MTYKDPDRAREYNRNWQAKRRAELKAQAKPLEPRACLICLSVFAPRNKDPRYVYCSRTCKARSTQIRRYGITLEEYRAILVAQGGRCAICFRAPGVRNFHIDHNHSTGAVRGLLCAGCNPGLGNFREDPDALRNAADYLERHNQ